MNHRETIPDRLYLLHHSLDPITLPISRRILKLNGLSRAKDNFDWDLLNDIGIINLLRQDYLRHGSIKKTFSLYQSTRLDGRSHRYESILALLIVTIVGTVVAGLVLDLYRANKQKLSGWILRLRQEAQLFKEDEPDTDIFKVMLEGRGRIRLAQKFASATAKEVIKDLDAVLKCFTARQMLDGGLISYCDYLALVERLLANKPHDPDDSHWSEYLKFEREYSKSDAFIDKAKVMLAIEAYTRGTLHQKLEEVGVDLGLQRNVDVAAVFDGIPASPGAASGVSHVLGYDQVDTKHPIIVAADANRFQPSDISAVAESAGVVTTNCGLTGHIPLLCRGLGIPCAIVKPAEFARIHNGDRLGLSGTTGLVGVGVVVEL